MWIWQRILVKSNLLMKQIDFILKKVSLGRNKNKRFIFSLGRHLEALCLEKKGSLRCCRANVIKYLVPCNMKFKNVLGLPLDHTERCRLFLSLCGLWQPGSRVKIPPVHKRDACVLGASLTALHHDRLLRAARDLALNSCLVTH